MRRVALLVTVAVLLAGALIVFWPSATNALPVGDASTESSHALELEPGQLPPGAAAGKATADDEPDRTERRALEASEGDNATEPKLLRILVTKRNSGEPVPGALVAYFDGQSIDFYTMSVAERRGYLPRQRLGVADAQARGHGHGRSQGTRPDPDPEQKRPPDRDRPR